MLVYLAGSIEFSADRGQGWRRVIKPFLIQTLGHEVYDPSEDEKKNLSNDEIANFRGWKTADLERYRKVVRKIINFDLDLIEKKVNYVICMWGTEDNLAGGTAAELTLAYRKKIPVYLITGIPIDRVSGWVLGCADKIFLDLESLKEFLCRMSDQNSSRAPVGTLRDRSVES